MDPAARQPRGDRAAQSRGLPRRRRDEPVGHRPGPVRHGNAERDAPEDASRGGRRRRADRRGVLLPAHGRRPLRLPQAEARDDEADRGALRDRSGGYAGGRRFAARPAGGRGARLSAASRADGQGQEGARRGRAAGRHARARRSARVRARFPFRRTRVMPTRARPPSP
ncbi:phosphatase [Burkholderia pseudomallei MSHR1043]|nr:phosphatase [Burkholderia pseudomallei MSHR1043]